MSRKIKLLLVMKCMIFFYGHIRGENIPEETKKETIKKDIKNQKEFFKNSLELMGFYGEGPLSFKKGIVFEENNQKKIFYFGPINEIYWDKCILPLEEIQKMFPEFEKGQIFQNFIANNILLTLHLQTHKQYSFALGFLENGKVNVFLKEKPEKIYFIKKIRIKNNSILQEKDILDAIDEICSPLNIIEKIKYIGFGKTSALVIGPHQIHEIKKKIKILSEKNLIINSKVEVHYELDPYTHEAIVYLYIQEGSKYFLDNISIEGCPFIKKFFIRQMINQYGMRNGSFSYLEDLIIKEYDEADIKVTFSYNNQISINILVQKQKEISSFLVESIFFENCADELTYITKHIPVSIGEELREGDLKKFCHLLTYLLEKKFTYKIEPISDKVSNKVIVKFIEVKKSEESSSQKEFIKFKDNSLLLQYPFQYIPPYDPRWKIRITPKIPFSWPYRLRGGTGVTIVYRYSEKIFLDLLNGEIVCHLWKWNNFKEFLQSFNANICQLEYKKRDTQYLFCPASLHKYHNNKMKLEKTDGMYFYTNLSGRHIWKFDTNTISLYGYSKVFLYPGSLKFGLQPELLVPLRGNWQLLFSSKGIFNTQNPQDIYNHLSATSIKHDGNHDILFNWYKTPHPLTNEDINYIYEKGIILSHAITNIRIMLMFKVFNLHIPSMGDLNVFISGFCNVSHDLSNNTSRFSIGFALMGNFNKMMVTIALGLKNNLHYPDQDDKGLQYGYSVEPCFF